ncbi:MAG: hypothetical protein ACOX5Z_07220 [Desulfobulbus sp.]|jgi:hypothetical protein
MQTDSQPLDDEYQQLQEILELYPAISLLEYQEHPIRSYRIAYDLRGYSRDENGQVQIASRHLVQIDLPDTSPQTVPVARPLTPVFHPDAGPDGLGIDAQWRAKPSLVELVLHIGEMLCGARYSRDKALDAEAAQWYRQHEQELPLDILTIASIEEPADGPEKKLVDDALASLDLEMIELDREEQAAPPASQDSSRQQLDTLRRLLDDRAMFAARELISSLSSSPDLQIELRYLTPQVEQALAKAQQLHQLAHQLMEMDQYEEAFEIVEILVDTVADDPELPNLRTQIHNASRRFSEAPLPAETASATHDEAPSPSEAPPPAEPPVADPAPDSEAEAAPAVPTTVPRRSRRRAVALAIALVLGLGIATALLSVRDQRAINQIRTMQAQGRDLIEQMEFTKAQSLLQSARGKSQTLTLLRFRQNELVADLDQVLASKALQEGLQGRALYRGTYIEVDRAKALREIDRLVEQGQKSLDRNQLSEALALYRQALALADAHQDLKEQQTLRETVQSLEIRDSLAQAEQADRDKDWEKAAAAYHRALSLSGDSEKTAATAEITSRMTAASFRRDLDQAKKTFQQSQWGETIRLLEQAQATIAANPDVVTEQERHDLDALLLNARLSALLANARAAYQRKDWDAAIDAYQEALKLLSPPSGAQTMQTKSVEQIEQTLLMIQVTRLQEQMHIAEREGKTAAMLSRGRELQRLLRTGRHADDPEITALLADITAQLTALESRVQREQQEQWLTKNFQRIFRTHYPTYKGSTLSEPQVRLLTTHKGKAVYSLSCTEHSGGRSSRIELRYQFDPATNTWSVFQK